MSESAPPITLVASRTACRNAVFTVFLDHIRDAGGAEVPDYVRVVPHHRVEGGVTGVAVLPVLDGRFGLIRVYRHPIGDYCWEAPRGFVDQGETAAAAARRELLEETGLSAEPGALRELGIIAPEPGLIDARVRLYAAEHCRRAPEAAFREVGHGELRFFDRHELVGIMGGGGLMDPCTLVCCYRYLGIGA